MLRVLEWFPFAYCIAKSPTRIFLGTSIILCLDDLRKNLTCPVLAYTEDVKLYYQISSLNDHDELRQVNLCRISEWCNNNGLTLNILKCYHPTLSSKTPLLYSCLVHSKEIACMASGITFDADLTFMNHLTST